MNLKWLGYVAVFCCLKASARNLEEDSEKPAQLVDQGNTVQANTEKASTNPSEPRIAKPIGSQKIIAGSNAVLKCVVKNLGEHKVAWKNVGTQNILSLGTRVFTPNDRISVTHTDENTWHLNIREVTKEDTGYYTCQINTPILVGEVGYLNVVEPPEFVANMTNRNITVMENHNLTLSCKATGSPEPNITWRREDEQVFLVDGRKVLYHIGDELVIIGVKKSHMATYLCIANNDVPPAISRRIYIDVRFPPLIQIRNHVVGASIGSDVSLECQTEAHPPSKNYWTRDGVELPRNERFETYITRNSYKVHMKLTLRKLKPEDYGEYKCVAQNSLRETEGTIYLHKSSLPVPEEKKVVTNVFPTKPTRRTTVAVTADIRMFTTELTRTEKSYEPGKQQKYGNGRSTAKLAPEGRSNAQQYISLSWIVLSVCLRTALFNETRWI